MIVDQKLNKLIVGVYLIDDNMEGTQLATTIKPNRVRKILIKWILGWNWISIHELKLKK